MARQRTILALIVAAGLALGACRPAAQAASPSPPGATSEGARGSASPSPSGAAAPDGPGGPDPCLLVSASLAAEFTGESVGPAQRSNRGDGTACVYAASRGGAATVGVTVSAAAGTAATLAAVASAAPDAAAVAGLPRVLVATGGAWLLLDGRLVSVVLVRAGGSLATPAEMRNLAGAIIAAAQAPAQAPQGSASQSASPGAASP